MQNSIMVESRKLVVLHERVACVVSLLFFKVNRHTMCPSDNLKYTKVMKTKYKSFIWILYEVSCFI